MIGIIGAMDVEIAGLVKKMVLNEQKQISNFVFYKGKIGNCDVVVVKSGIGKVASSLSASLLYSFYHVDLIINTGIAGGTKNLKSEDIILVNTLSYKDCDATVFGYKLGQVPGMPYLYHCDANYVKKIETILEKANINYKIGHALTSDSFVTTLKDYKGEIFQNMICEMEGAAIAQCAYMLNIPFIAIRYISDIIDFESQIADYKEFENNMAHKSCELLYDIISNL